MLLQDLFEKIEPGQRKAIQLQIDKYERAIRDIEDQEANLSSLDYDDYKIAGAEKELEDLKQSYQKYVDDLKSKLASAKQGKGADSFEKYMAAIVRHCPTIVAACKSTGKLLYRGTKEDAPAFYGKPFNDRYAKDSSSEVHAAWNAAMDAAGVVAKRDNSIFTTTSRSLASNFGSQVYIVFFRDPLHFTWSDSERDLVLSTEMMDRMVNPETVKQLMSYVWQNDELREEYKKMFRILKYESTAYPVEFDPATYPTGEHHEIFRKYNFKYSFDAFINILPKLPAEFQKYGKFEAWVDPQKVIENFGLHIDEDLEGAFKQGYEITIRAEYYAIRADLEKKVRQYLGMGQYSDNSY
jgi:hypothetical protein